LNVLDQLLMLTLEGAGRLRFRDGTSCDVGRKELTLYHPRAPQFYSVSPDAGFWVIIWAHFQPRPHWLAWLKWPEAAPGVGRVQLDDAAFAAARRELAAMDRAVKEAAEPDLDLGMNHLERALLIARSAVPATTADKGPRDPRMVKALELIHRRLSSRMTVGEMAQAAGLSVSGFAHLFREVTGAAPAQYVELRRLEKASELLRSSPLSVKEVADELGFDDPFYFSRRFRSKYGVSPAAWRKSSK
jgi:AraC family transcriptional regulator of arabinose operon